MRTWKRGSTHYATIDGKRISLRATDSREAERNLADYLTDRRDARKPLVTVGELWDVYSAGRDTGTHAWRWKNLSPVFAERLPITVTEQLCQEYAASRKGGAQATIHGELRLLRTILNNALKKRLIDPEFVVWLPPEPQPKDLRMTREQAGALINAAYLPHVKLFIILGLMTAGRHMAILDLTWDRVDFARGTVNLDLPGKSGKRRAIVPMNATLRAALMQAHQERTCAHVIEWNGSRVHQIDRSFRETAKRAGLQWVTPHVLRHTAASLMLQGGVPIEKVGQYLGHSQLAITYRIYARHTAESLSDAADMLDFGVKPTLAKDRTG